VGVYDRGKYSNVQVADAILPKIYAEKNVVLIKDSSTTLAGETSLSPRDGNARACAC